jgi:hypothetical protein
MTLQEQKIQAVLALVKQFQGRSGLQYWRYLGLTESRRPHVNKWLRTLEARGLVRHDDRVIDGRVYARMWWPV